VKTLLKNALKESAQGHRTQLGKTIIHYQMENGTRTPFHGRVVSILPDYPEWYICIYKDDEAVYVFNLAVEQMNGDLEIDVKR